MLEPVLRAFAAEIKAMEDRTRQILKGCGRYAWDSPSFPQKAEQRYWLPALCLLSAKLAKGTNPDVVHLAGILHLFNLASSLHLRLPEDSEAAVSPEDIQYPILVGDLLYSWVCGDICRFQLQQYLHPLASLIGSFHEELVQRDDKARQNRPYQEHEIKIHALLTESTCFLGAHAAAGNNQLTEKIRKLGFNLGILKAVWELDWNIEAYLNNWAAAWLLLDSVPASWAKEAFRHILLVMGAKWRLEEPRFQETLERSWMEHGD